MNVLKPELVRVDGQCYRLLGNGEWSNSREIPPYVEDNEKMDCSDSEEECQDAGIEIQPFGAGRFKHKFSVSKVFFPYIIGPKHAVRKKLESETGTQLRIPKWAQDRDIEIFGSKPSGIIKARRRIDLLVESARKKIPATHFLAIPLNGEQMRVKFDEFKSEVLGNSGSASRGVTNKVFQHPSKLHLTIEVLTLLDDQDRRQAIDALNYCKEHILKPAIEKHGQIPIRLRGVDVMNNDPSKAWVLYAKVVDESGVLQEILNSIASYCGSTGLVWKRRDHVKLHVTLMNMRYIGERSNTTFDASEILKVHEDTDFGETTLRQIDICELHNTNPAGYYSKLAEIQLAEAP